MSEQPYDGHERRNPADAIAALTTEVTRLVTTSATLTTALTALGDVQQKQVELETRTTAIEYDKTASDDKAVTRRSRDNWIFAAVIIALLATIVSGVIGYRITSDARDVLTRGQNVVRDQRLVGLQDADTKCLADNDRNDSQRLFLKTLASSGLTPTLRKAVTDFIAAYPVNADCTTYSKQIASLVHRPS